MEFIANVRTDCETKLAVMQHQEERCGSFCGAEQITEPASALTSLFVESIDVGSSGSEESVEKTVSHTKQICMIIYIN